ncbi:hypothetical protein AB0L47_34945 [Streptomyces bobili]|uniref:hypothetical protein n=1 Tax=Streptomyces bobili TaxID=67280 RepID=UPI003441FE0C
MTFAGYLVRFRPHPDVDPRFLAYIARSAPFQHTIQAEAVSSTIQNFNAERYANIRFAAPDVTHQRRIADFLDTETEHINALTRARNSQLRCLEELWQSVLADRAATLIASHGVVPLRRVITSVEQGWSPQCDDAEASPSEWAVLKTSAVSTGTFQPLQHKRLPKEIQPDLRLRITDGDILLTRGSGSPDLVGVAALARTEGRQLLLSDLLYRVRLRGDWSPDFVTSMLGSKPVRGLISLLLRGQSGQTIKLRAEDIKSIGVPATPTEIQPRVAGELKEMHNRIHAAQHAIHRSLAILTERRQALITAAVTGQFDVSTASGRNVTEGVTV